MKKVRHYLFTRIRHWLIVHSIEALHSPSGGPQASPLFSDTPCRIDTGPDSKAAMDRPQQSRGVATAPGVQRKAPRTVIQREEMPKGPRLEEQRDLSQRPTPVAGRGKAISLMQLGYRLHWEINWRSAMAKGVVIKYECDACNELHDDEDGARECCMPGVIERFFCPICDESHDEEANAQKCILSHADIESADDEHCPNCLRLADTAQFRIEIAVAGHCSTCNPLYNPDQNLRIKYALDSKGA